MDHKRSTLVGYSQGAHVEVCRACHGLHVNSCRIVEVYAESEQRKCGEKKKEPQALHESSVWPFWVS